MPDPAPGIDYFYRRHPLTRWQVRASLRIRRRIYDWFCLRLGGVRGRTFLDHGTTPDTERGDSNCFIKWLLADGAVVYAASPEDIGPLAGALPGLRLLPWPPRPEQLAGVYAVISSAVLEHVGSDQRQIEYLAGLLAARRTVLVTTPNRRHWLEFHTKLPLLHWLPRRWHRALLTAVGLRFWADETNLNLVTRRDLIRQLGTASRLAAAPVSIAWFRPVFLGMVSNLVVLVEPFAPVAPSSP